MKEYEIVHTREIEEKGQKKKSSEWLLIIVSLIISDSSAKVVSKPCFFIRTLKIS